MIHGMYRGSQVLQNHECSSRSAKLALNQLENTKFYHELLWFKEAKSTNK